VIWLLIGLLYLPQGEQSGCAPIYRIETVPYATEYELQVFGIRGKHIFTNRDWVCERSFCYGKKSYTLKPGKGYWWRVRAKVRGVWGEYSEMVFFSIKEDACKEG
jgi:hypothetical protein